MLQASAYAIVSPSFMEPEILIQQTQASGFIDLLQGSQLRVRMAQDDLLVYMKQMNIRTKAAAGQTGSFQELPGVDIFMSMISTASYKLKTRAQYDHHDVAAGGNWGLPVPEAFRLGMRQANFQLCRDASLYGMHPEDGEGVINAPGVTAINLPPDSNGQDTVLGYDNGEMAFFLSQVILAIKTRTVQLGRGRKFTILGPQRTLGTFEYNVVQLTQFQRIGAGTDSTKGTLESIVQENGDEVTWAYDDTLIGKGAGGADAVIVSMPEVDVPSEDGINTNVFGAVTPNNSTCVTQYADMAAPREILTPLPGGATDVVTEWGITSGWVPRPQAVTVISMPYSDD